jgi:hypothetical protein
MQVGELFIKLSIKGGDDAAKTIKTTKDTLKEAKTSALEVRAGLLGIVAALYEMKQFASQAVGVGQALTGFANLTGLSTIELQRWQQALINAGITADQTANAIVNIQKKFSDVLLHGDTGGAITALTRTVNLDVNKAQQDPYYLLKKAREYALRTNNPKDIGFGNFVLSQLLPENIIAGLRNPAVGQALGNPNYNRIYSGREQSELNKVKIAIDNFVNAIEHISGRLIVALGPEVRKGLKDLADNLETLGHALDFILKIPVIHQLLSTLAAAFGNPFPLLNIYKGAKQNPEAYARFKSGVENFVLPELEKFAQPYKEQTINNDHSVSVTATGNYNAKELADMISRENARQYNIAIRQAPQQ